MNDKAISNIAKYRVSIEYLSKARLLVAMVVMESGSFIFNSYYIQYSLDLMVIKFAES